MSRSDSSDIQILLVEDDPLYAQLVLRCLEKNGISRPQVRHCEDGESAIRVLEDAEVAPSFVLLDLRLPKRDGLDVLEWIRTRPRFANLHVFVMALEAKPDDVARAFELGVSSYFVKPGHIHDLESILEGMVAFTRRREARKLSR